MPFEVPKACETCPVVSQCQTALTSLEENEDKMIMDLMGTAIEDDAKQWADQDVQMMMRNEEGEMVQVPFTPELARQIAAHDLDHVQSAISVYTEMLKRSTTGCIGALALSAVEDEISYEVIVCRSQPKEVNFWFDEEYTVEADEPSAIDDEKVQMALVKRKSIVVETE